MTAQCARQWMKEDESEKKDGPVVKALVHDLGPMPYSATDFLPDLAQGTFFLGFNSTPV